MASYSVVLRDSPEFSGAPASFPDNGSARLADMVQRVQEGDSAGMAELYEFISQGLSSYVGRQLRSQDFSDKIHNVFVDVVVAIRRGQVRDPCRLMGFVHTIARRRVARYIEAATTNRRNQVDISAIFWLASPHATPESELLYHEQQALAHWTLAHLSSREGEILSRFYVQEQDQAQICTEMGLTHNQFRLLKWRSKAHFQRLSQQRILGQHLRSPGAAGAH